jgi:hypothetical protein
MNAKLLIVISAIASTMMVGCASTNSPNATRNEIPLFSNGGPYAATFETHKEVMEMFDSTGKLLDEDAVAYLWNTSDSAVRVPVAGGTVSMNGTSLTLVDETANGGGKYYQNDVNFDNTVPFSTSGGSLVFSASGGASFAGLADSITFPNSDIHVTAPTFSTSISKSAGFTVTWNYISGSTNSIAIQVIGDSSGYQLYLVSDNGNYSVPSADLSAFSGNTRVRVSRISYKSARDASNRNYAMVAYTTSTIYHSLVP